MRSESCSRVMPKWVHWAAAHASSVSRRAKKSSGALVVEVDILFNFLVLLFILLLYRESAIIGCSALFCFVLVCFLLLDFDGFLPRRAAALFAEISAALAAFAAASARPCRIFQQFRLL